MPDDAAPLPLVKITATGHSTPDAPCEGNGAAASSASSNPVANAAHHAHLVHASGLSLPGHQRLEFVAGPDPTEIGPLVGGSAKRQRLG